MKYLTLLIFTFLSTTLVAQESNHLIVPIPAEKKAAFNAQFISIINQKRAETDLAPLVESDSLSKLATQYVGYFVGIGDGDLAPNTVDQYFVGYDTRGKEVDVSDVVRTHWVTSSDGRFPGIKPHYTKVGIGSILKDEQLLNYVIFK
jgi:hypothetical protein